MSTASKKRRRAREWMHSTVDEYEKRIADLSKEANRLVKAAREDERKRLTRLIPRDEHDDRVVYPMGKPTHPVIKIPMCERYPVSLDQMDYYRSPISARFECETLRCTQYALRLQDGTSVVWFGWEIAR